MKLSIENGRGEIKNGINHQMNSNQDVHLIGCQILEDFNAYSKEDIFCVATIVSDWRLILLSMPDQERLKLNPWWMIHQATGL